MQPCWPSQWRSPPRPRPRPRRPPQRPGSPAPTSSNTISAFQGVRRSRPASTPAPGATVPRHKHPGEELVYVLNGTLEYRIDGQPTAVLRAGDVLFIPAGTVHSAINVGVEGASELATYVVEKGKPLVVLIK